MRSTTIIAATGYMPMQKRDAVSIGCCVSVDHMLFIVVNLKKSKESNHEAILHHNRHQIVFIGPGIC